MTTDTAHCSLRTPTAVWGWGLAMESMSTCVVHSLTHDPWFLTLTVPRVVLFISPTLRRSMNGFNGIDSRIQALRMDSGNMLSFSWSVTTFQERNECYSLKALAKLNGSASTGQKLHTKRPLTRVLPLPAPACTAWGCAATVCCRSATSSLKVRLGASRPEQWGHLIAMFCLAGLNACCATIGLGACCRTIGLGPSGREFEPVFELEEGCTSFRCMVKAIESTKVRVLVGHSGQRFGYEGPRLSRAKRTRVRGNRW